MRRFQRVTALPILERSTAAERDASGFKRYLPTIPAIGFDDLNVR